MLAGWYTVKENKYQQCTRNLAVMTFIQREECKFLGTEYMYVQPVYNNPNKDDQPLV